MSQESDSAMIRVHRGKQAVALIADSAFRQKWAALYEACPYGTCFQDIPFVTTWYRSYAERFEPVIVEGAEEDSSLTGLLTLALSKENNTLVPAGTDHAEYQVWLARDGQSDNFIESALNCLGQEFSAGQLRFRYLPTGTPLEWSVRWKGRCHLRSVPRLLMSTRPGNTIAQSLRKRSMRSRLNRLKRVGEITFRRVVDPAEISALLDEIIPLHDFRQGAAYLNYPFCSDVLKKPFHLAMMEHPNLMHVTVLQVNSRIVAAHIGLRNKQQVSLGILTHSPLFSQYSVGKFHILLLGLDLQNEGFTDFDLTPGGEEYKERFASHRDEAHMLDVLLRPSRVRQLRLHLGDPMRFNGFTRLRAREIAAQIRHRAIISNWLMLPGELIRQLKVALWNTKEICLYSRNRSRNGIAQPHWTMRRDCLQDLLLFKPPGPWQRPRHEFLREAADRLKNGYHVYTHVLDGQLVHYGWLLEKQENCPLPEGPAFTLPLNSAVLFDFYTHLNYRGLGIYAKSLRQIFFDAAASEIQHIYLFVPENETTAGREIENAGFVYEKSFFEGNRFGRVRRWEGTPPVVTVSKEFLRQSENQFERNSSGRTLIKGLPK
ncbi:MAG TPA: GNAT family N-acetyltransferase [Candidatus Saccharimonadales bacterium]|jgi:CelD/BcsL family acetyltransferase involved in cellulose biosynthesis|nr:GNAT family N-acetyltransferase [Candidatus Saccharimonadales bacterium]